VLSVAASFLSLFSLLEAKEEEEEEEAVGEGARGEEGDAAEASATTESCCFFSDSASAAVANSDAEEEAEAFFLALRLPLREGFDVVVAASFVPCRRSPCCCCRLSSEAEEAEAAEARGIGNPPRGWQRSKQLTWHRASHHAQAKMGSSRRGSEAFDVGDAVVAGAEDEEGRMSSASPSSSPTSPSSLRRCRPLLRPRRGEESGVAAAEEEAEADAGVALAFAASDAAAAAAASAASAAATASAAP